ncbi:hypothetical protein IWX46DRAFT_433037 [Phyllosticta citricarpa]|uniref:HTH Mu-type domain-containing protein n=1 Tax=Phyllosticta citricarpa TaxID=55181 RepID=A0ABR1L2C3_9PEZI
MPREAQSAIRSRDLAQAGGHLVVRARRPRFVGDAEGVQVLFGEEEEVFVRVGGVRRRGRRCGDGDGVGALIVLLLLLLERRERAEAAHGVKEADQKHDAGGRHEDYPLPCVVSVAMVAMVVAGGFAGRVCSINKRRVSFALFVREPTWESSLPCPNHLFRICTTERDGYGMVSCPGSKVVVIALATVNGAWTKPEGAPVVLDPRAHSVVFVAAEWPRAKATTTSSSFFLFLIHRRTMDGAVAGCGSERILKSKKNAGSGFWREQRRNKERRNFFQQRDAACTHSDREDRVVVGNGIGCAGVWCGCRVSGWQHRIATRHMSFDFFSRRFSATTEHLLPFWQPSTLPGLFVPCK